MLKKGLVTNLIFREICKGNIPQTFKSFCEARRKTKRSFVLTVLLIFYICNVIDKKMKNPDLVRSKQRFYTKVFIRLFLCRILVWIEPTNLEQLKRSNLTSFCTCWRHHAYVLWLEWDCKQVICPVVQQVPGLWPILAGQLPVRGQRTFDCKQMASRNFQNFSTAFER